MSTAPLTLADLDKLEDTPLSKTGEGQGVDKDDDQKTDPDPKDDDDPKKDSKNDPKNDLDDPEKDSPEDEQEDEEEEEEDDDSPADDKKTGKSKETEDDDSVYSDINKLLGFAPEEEFEDSPAGYAKYAETYAQHTIRTMETNMQAKFPNVYAYLVHSINGGTDEEFFNSTREESIPTVDEENEDTQRSIITRSLKEQGWSEKRITKWIQTLEEDGELYDEAKTHHDKLTKAAQERDKAKQEEIDRINSEKIKQVNEMNTTLEKMINGGNIRGFAIPNNEKGKFAEFMRQNLVFNKGKFYLNREVDPANLEQELQNEFFRYRKGDIKDYIERKAATVSVKKLQRDKGKKKISVKDTSSPIMTLRDV